MPITLDNADQVVEFKAIQHHGSLPQGIQLNLDSGVAWNDRFVSWPPELSGLGTGPGGIPTQAEADVWADEWATSKSLLTILAEVGTDNGLIALGKLGLTKGLWTNAELRAFLEAERP